MPIDVLTDGLTFAFPEIDPDAVLTIRFQRTLRVPDDGATFDLPPGLGEMPLRRTDDLPAHRLPARWLGHDDASVLSVVMPMWQSEACWLRFDSRYSFLVKVAAGRVNAVTGGSWSPEPDFAEEDYFEVPNQPWLDGFCVDGGAVRQFVAMPLGGGYSVEEQVTGQAEYGGIQIAVVPLKGAVHRERVRAMAASRPTYFAPPSPSHGGASLPVASPSAAPDPGTAPSAMGLAPGGSIKQSVAVPVEHPDNWAVEANIEACVHIANSAEWESVTGTPPPRLPLSAAAYTEHGYPWFSWYDDTFARAGSVTLSSLDSVTEMSGKRAEQALPENESFDKPEPWVLGGPVTEDGQPL